MCWLVARPTGPYLTASSLKRTSSSSRGSRNSRMALTLRFSQWATSSLYRLHAHPTPPSRMPTRRAGKPPGDPAEEQRLAQGLAARREVADVVVDPVRRRTTEPDVGALTVGADRDPEIDAALPEGVVVVVAVDAVGVEPEGPSLGLGVRALVSRSRPGHIARNHHGPKAQLTHGILQLRDRLGRGVRRDRGHGDEAVGASVKGVPVVAVEGPTGPLAELVGWQLQEGQAGARIDDRHVTAEFVHAAVEIAREARGGSILGDAHRPGPPRRLHHVPTGPLLGGQVPVVPNRTENPLETGR